jgi:hypothetical protein
MSSRAADATIKGYYYQFDTAILKLLELPTNTDHIVVEGIEDIDINIASETTTVQCKYLSKPNFINSAVREPIILMLDHFVSPATPNNLNYTLYAHFENETPGSEPSIDLARLKEILTYKENKIQKVYHTDKGISDHQLTSFLTKFKFVFGKEFSAQQKLVLSKLKGAFSCTDFEADTYFYNNALRLIIDKAILADVGKRKIIKSDFIRDIDSRKKLFNEWYIKLRSKKDYLTIVANSLKSAKALEPSRSKCIIIGNELFSADNSELPPVTLIENLINKYYRMSISLRNAKPLLLVLDCDNTLLVDLKKKLITNSIHFNDGYEHIAFNADALNRSPVINTTASNTKIAQSSFSIKIVSLHTFVTHLSDIDLPKVVLHFAKAECPYAKSDDYQWFDIKYCENLKDISTLIL